MILHKGDKRQQQGVQCKRVTGRHGGGERRAPRSARPGPGESLLFHKVWEARTWVLEPGMFKMEL